MNRKSLGLILIAIGASVWFFYAAAKLAGMQIEFAFVLLTHLLFVIPGALLAPGEHIYGKLIKRIKPVKEKQTLQKEPEK